MFLGWLALFIGFIAAVKSDGECGGFLELTECFELHQGASLEGWDGLPDEDFLDENCGPFIQRIECVRNVLQNCPEFGDYVDETLPVIESGLNVLHSVCDEDSEARKKYLENVECYNRVYPQMIECANSSQQLVDAFFKSVRDDPETKEIINSDCLSKPLILGCAVEESEEVCGEEATEPLSHIVSQISSIIKESDCPSEEDLAEWEARFILFVSGQALQSKK